MQPKVGETWIDPQFVAWKVVELGQYSTLIESHGITIWAYTDRMVKAWTKVMPDKGQM